MQPFLTDDFFLFYFMNQNEIFRESLDYSDLEQYIGVYSLEGRHYHGEIELPHQFKGVLNNQLMIIRDDDPDHFIIGLYEIELN